MASCRVCPKPFHHPTILRSRDPRHWLLHLFRLCGQLPRCPSKTSGFPCFVDLKKPQLPSQHCWVTNHMKLVKLVEAHQAATALKSKRESTVSLVKLSSHHSKAFSNNSPLELENTSPRKLSRSLREGFHCILVIGSRCWKRLISSKYCCSSSELPHSTFLSCNTLSEFV